LINFVSRVGNAITWNGSDKCCLLAVASISTPFRRRDAHLARYRTARQLMSFLCKVF